MCVNVCVTSLLLRLPSVCLCVKYALEENTPLVEHIVWETGGVCTAYSKLAQDYVYWLPCHYMGRLDEPSFRY